MNATTRTLCEPLIDVKAAAKILHLSEETVRRHVRAETIPHVRLGSRVLFRESRLNEWLNQIECRPPLVAAQTTKGAEK